jgi:cellulose synthase/poly-beta-1,6-N-acetylglucosamine synthase-like glycosyltransferase
MIARIKQRSIGVTVLLGLICLIAFFYAFSVNSASLYVLLLAYLLTLALDIFILTLHILRPFPSSPSQAFDPKSLTVFIACYNGADIIAQTFKEALQHVPANQIIVISDNSNDDTVSIAKSMGVQVYENDKNYGKSMSINRHIHRVKTPYTLILDDDTLIGRTFLPTSLLDAGYSAVAFEVMPIPTKSLANKFQQFEYQKTMTIRKGLRASTGSVGNVSGAIGLYHTKALQAQAIRHSGQSGGEDQQRTLLTHLENAGKGVTYCGSTVQTLAPDSLAALFKQRAFKWNTSGHENFLLMLRAVLHPHTHYLLKIEKAYALFILLTEPFRMLAFFLILFAPIGSFMTHLALIWLFYVWVEMAAWLKTGRLSPVWVVVVFPFYGKLCAVARSIAHFYWYKKKYLYVVKNKFHRLISGRKLLREYAAVSTVLVVVWSIAIYKIVTLLRSSSAGAKISYRIPQWQALESLPATISLAHILVIVFAVWFLAGRLYRVLGRLQRPKDSAVSPAAIDLN